MSDVVNTYSVFRARSQEEAKFYELLVQQYYVHLGYKVFEVGSKLEVVKEVKLTRTKRTLILELNSFLNRMLVKAFVSPIFWLSKALLVKECHGEIVGIERDRAVTMNFLDGEFDIKEYNREVTERELHNLSKSGFTDDFLLFLFKNLYDAKNRNFHYNDFGISESIKKMARTNRKRNIVEKSPGNFSKTTHYLNEYYGVVLCIFEELKKEFLWLVDAGLCGNLGTEENLQFFKSLIAYKRKRISKAENDLTAMFKNRKAIKHIREKQKIFDEFEDAVKDNFIATAFILESTRDKHHLTKTINVTWQGDARKKDYKLGYQMSLYAELGNRLNPEKFLSAEDSHPFFKDKIEQVKPEFLVNYSRANLFDYRTMLQKGVPVIRINDSLTIPVTNYFVNLLAIDGEYGEEPDVDLNLKKQLLYLNQKGEKYPSLEIDNNLPATRGDDQLLLCDICVHKIKSNTIGCDNCIDFEFLFPDKNKKN